MGWNWLSTSAAIVMDDLVTLYSYALPVFLSAGSAFLSGAVFGVWVVLRFFEVHRGEGD